MISPSCAQGKLTHLYAALSVSASLSYFTFTHVSLGICDNLRVECIIIESTDIRFNWSYSATDIANASIHKLCCLHMTTTKHKSVTIVTFISRANIIQTYCSHTVILFRSYFVLLYFVACSSSGTRLITYPSFHCKNVSSL